jgi:FkbM family methyltransferase
VAADTVVGSLLLPANDQVMTNLIGREGTWELAESAALMALIRPGANIVDIGAHVGYMTLLAASRTAGGDVLAVEANRDNFELLCANLARNGVTNVRAIQGAAWRRSGETLTMTVCEDNTGDHRVFARDGAETTVEVPALAVDDLIPDEWHVDVVKVDVQGTDHVAIEGMRATIERCRPAMLVEFWPAGIEEFGDPPTRALELYSELGYEIAVLEAPGLSSGSSPARIVDTARRAPHQYCTLLMQPRR